MPDILEVPLDSEDPSFKLRTTLEDVQLVLRFDWVIRIARWSMSIFDDSESPILLGVTLNVNNELLERFEIPALPPGKMLLYDTSGRWLECGRNDLGDRCKLFYETSV